MKKLFILLLSSIFLISCSNSNMEKTQHKTQIVEYGDFKCPYCKNIETNIMPKLKKNYILTNKADYKFVNMAFLGDDSIKGSRASHAIKNIAPDKYLKFQNLMFSKQPNHEEKWITEQLIDKQINKLNLSRKKTKQIKNDYKTKNSQSWKDAKKDKIKYKKNNIKQAPTVFINGKKLKDPYNYKEYKKYLK